MAQSRSYKYEPPTYEQTVERAERKTTFDPMFKDVKIYRPRQGNNLIRILPPGWSSKNNHYGLVIYIHRDVGPFDRQYLCLRDNPTSPHRRCPVCDELFALGTRASQEERNLLRPKESVIYYIIDRENEKEGVQVYMTSSRTDSEIAAQMTNHRTKSVIDIVHPDHGYDVEFIRTGTTRNNTQYRGFRVVRESSPLSDSDRLTDEWLDVAFDKPLPSILQFYSPEHIEQVFRGKSSEEGTTKDRSRDDRDDRDRDERPRERSREPEPDEERPIRRTRSTEDDPPRRSRSEEDEPRRSRERDPEPEPEVERPRSRARDDDDAPRSRRTERDERDNAPDDRDERTSRPARDRSPPDDAEDEPAPRRRSRTAEELDDEVPSEGARRARPNGRDEPTEPERERTGRRQPDDADDDPPPRRRRTTTDDDEPRRTSEPDDHEGRRERLRERLNRE